MQTGRFAMLALAACATPALGQDNQPPAKQVTALQDCRSKIDSVERLACYDRAVDALTAATTARDIVIIDRKEVKEARRGLFGFSLPKLGFLKSDDKDAEEDERIVTTVISSRNFNRDQWRFTVEGGAVWETTEVTRGFDDPKPGATVTIERGTFGAYHAVVGKRGRAKVRRLQ